MDLVSPLSIPASPVQSTCNTPRAFTQDPDSKGGNTLKHSESDREQDVPSMHSRKECPHVMVVWIFITFS